VKFAHPVEEQFAWFLNYHGVEWQYEPHFFVLARNEKGIITRGFQPDFYLPEIDVYVELTMARRGRCNVKRKKIEQTLDRHNKHVVLLHAGDIGELVNDFAWTFAKRRKV